MMNLFSMIKINPNRGKKIKSKKNEEWKGKIFKCCKQLFTLPYLKTFAVQNESYTESYMQKMAF